MKTILDSIKGRLREFSENTAQAISDSDWRTVARNTGLVLAVVLGAAVLVIAILALVGKIFGSLLGKIIMVPLVLFILGLSWKMNYEDAKSAQGSKSAEATLETWAEDVYDVVRDAMFLVLRSLSEYTAVIRPTSPGTVELPNGISIRDGYAVFTFFARISGSVDAKKLKKEANQTLRQMLRAHELSGIASDLVQIKGSWYCPLQVLDLVDYGDYINISVVFATEKTVELVHARKLFNLDEPKQRSQGKRDILYDDEL